MPSIRRPAFILRLTAALMAAACNLPISQAGAASRPEAGQALEAEVLVLEVMLDGEPLSSGLEAYREDGHVLLPLGELARLLTLAITVEPEKARAAGHVLQEEHRFVLDATAARATVKDREVQFEPRLVKVQDDDIYVSSRLLSRWLPIDFEVDLPTLQLVVKPRELLPLQARLARERAAARLAARSRAAPVDPRYPAATSPHAILGVPFIDQTFSTAFRSGPHVRETDAVYSAYAATDVLGMEGEAYFSTLRTGPSSSPNLRFSLGRRNPDATLLGPLRARAFSAGYLAAPNVPHVMSGSANGRGLSISNHRLGQPSSFDQQNLRGDLPPGWDVTLYYNDALVGYQQSRPDGQYVFDNLPLSFGRNEFRLVFHGPLGQTREERRSFPLNQSNLKPGKFYYQLAQHWADDGGERTVAQTEFALTDAVVATAGFARKPGFPGDSGATGYGLFGLRGYGNRYIASLQLAHAQTGGQLLDFGLLTQLGELPVDLQRLQRVGNFTSDMFLSGGNTLRSRDSLRVNRYTQLAGGRPLSLVLGLARETYEAGPSQLSGSLLAGTTLANYALAHTLRVQQLPLGRIIDGALQVSYRMPYGGLSAQYGYTLQPEAGSQLLSLSGDQSLGDGFRLNGGILHSFPTESTLVSAGLSKSLGRFGLGVNGSYSSQGDFVVALQLFVAMGRDPRDGRWFLDSQPLAGTGAVSARVFVDRNLNGSWDAGEELVPNAGFRAHGAGQPAARTGDAGTALLSRLLPGQYLDLALDPGTLEDPQWAPLKPGVRLLPRPGVVEVVDFPVVLTGEINGTVYLRTNKLRRAIGEASLELVNEAGEVVATTRSAFDGYYVLDQVRPGRYQLRIAAAQLASLRLVGDLSRWVEVPQEGGFVEDQDLELSLEPQ